MFDVIVVESQLWGLQSATRQLALTSSSGLVTVARTLLDNCGGAESAESRRAVSLSPPYCQINLIYRLLSRLFVVCRYYNIILQL